MSSNQYLSSQNSTLFSLEDDDDIDDDDFLKRSRNPNSNSGRTTSNSNDRGDLYNNMDRQHEQLIAKRKDIEEQSILSSQRALQMLRESEDIGIATADELYHQREQLENTERRLDDINATLKYSQKHIQGIKSVFGGIKNMFSRTKNESVSRSGPGSSVEPIPEHGARRGLHEAIDKAKKSDTGYEHPALRIRNIDDPANLTKSRHSGEVDSQDILNKNLDEMVGSLSRLKGLALDLGEEIESQNDLVENIISKSEKADMNISRQNKDMNRLLKR